MSNHVEKKLSTEKMFSTLAHEAAREAIKQHNPSPSGSSSSNSSTLQNALTYSLGKHTSYFFAIEGLAARLVGSWHICTVT